MITITRVIYNEKAFDDDEGKISEINRVVLLEVKGYSTPRILVEYNTTTRDIEYLSPQMEYVALVNASILQDDLISIRNYVRNELKDDDIEQFTE